ncbi:polyprotein [Lonicera maackii endornavirus]|nr:polyprotein [Lonicera maackii endornavirus]
MSNDPAKVTSTSHTKLTEPSPTEVPLLKEKKWSRPSVDLGIDLDKPIKRDLMTTGAIDCFLTGGITTKPVVKSGKSNLDRFNEMSSTLFRSGMHTSKNFSKTAEFGGGLFGQKKSLNATIHRVDLKFCHTQRRVLEDITKTKPQQPRGFNLAKLKDKFCCNASADSNGKLILVCGDCEKCKINNNMGNKERLPRGRFRVRPLTKYNGTETTEKPQEKRSQAVKERFVKYCRPIYKLLKKNEETPVTFSNDRLLATGIYGTTNATVNKESDMLGRDMGLCIDICKPGLGMINYVKYGYKNKLLTHYITSKDYEQYKKWLKEGMKDKTLKITAESLKRCTHLYPKDDNRHIGGNLLYKAIMLLIQTIKPQNLKRLVTSETGLTMKRVGKKTVMKLPKMEHRITDGYDGKEFGTAMQGHLMTRETVKAIDGPMLDRVYGHKCKYCKGVTIITNGHTGTNYNMAATVTRGRILNAIKYAVSSDKPLAELYLATSIVRDYSKHGLNRINDNHMETHCGFCGHDIIEDPPSLIENIEKLFVVHHVDVKMGLLHQLERMGYLDGSTLDATGEKNIIQQDLITLKHQLSRMRQDVVLLPSSMSSEALTTLNRVLMELEMRTDVVPRINESCTLGTTRALLSLASSMNEYQNTYLYGDCDLVIENAKCSNLWQFRPQLYYNKVGETYEKINKKNENNILLFDLNILRVDPAELVTTLISNGVETMYYIVPKITSNHVRDTKVCEGELQVRPTEDAIYIIPSWSDRPIRCDRDVALTWMHADYIITNERCCSITTERFANGLCLKKFEMQLAQLDSIPKQVATVADTISLTMPTLRVFESKGKFKFSMCGERTVLLNRELYRRMMIRNISGTNSYKELVDYGLGVANMKYNINDTVISFSDINHNIIKHTAAFVYSKMITKNNVNILTEKLIANINTIDGFVACFVINSMDVIINLANLDTNIISNIKHWLKEKSTQTKIKGIASHIDGLDIDNLMCYAREPVIKEYRGIKLKLNYKQAQCEHDVEDETSIRGKKCECCNIKNVKPDEKFCVACDEHSDHKCEHKCRMNHKVESLVICSCCNCKMTGSECECCKDVGQLEQIITSVPDSVEEIAEEKYKRTNKHHMLKKQKIKSTPDSKLKSAVAEPDMKIQLTDELMSKMVDNITIDAELKRISMAEKEKKIANLKEKYEIVGTEDIDKKTTIGDLLEVVSKDDESMELWIRLCAKTNEFYADLFLYGSEEGWARNALKAQPPNLATMESYLTFIPMGDTIIRNENIKIEKTYEASGSGNLCGLHSLQILYPEKNFRLEDLQAVCSNTANFTSDDLMKFALVNNLNLIVVNESISNITKSIEDDKFKAIIHSKAMGINIDHWQPGVITQTGLHVGLPYYPNHFSYEDRLKNCKKNGMDRRSLMTKELGNINLLKLEVNLFESLVETNLNPAERMFTITSGADEMTLSNNKQKKMEPNNGLFSVKVNKENIDLCEKIVNCLMRPSDFIGDDWFYDRSDEVPADATEGIRNLIEQNIRELAQIMEASKNEYYNPSLVSTHTTIQYEKMRDNLFKISGSVNLKPGDCIIGTVTGIKEEKYVESKVIGYVLRQMGEWSICSCQKCPKGTRIKVKVLKKNTGSIYRFLFSALRWDFRRDMKEVIAKAVGVDAVAGWGKTTEIRNISDNTTTIVAQTRAAVNNLKEKSVKAHSIISAEKAMIEKVKTKRLIIDEASMITWETLSIMMGKEVDEVMLYGNTKQICVVDMFSTQGLRSSKSILNQCKNIITHYESRRIGNPLAEELSLFDKSFSTQADHSTEFSTISWTDMKWDELNKIVETVETCSILCFYNNAVRLVTNKLRYKCPVSTIHKFQGLEDDNIIVLQWCPQGNYPGRITLDANRCFSAATRATKRLIWISVNEYSNQVPLHNRFGSSSGGNEGKIREQVNINDYIVRIASSMVSKVILYSKDKTVERLNECLEHYKLEGSRKLVKQTVTDNDIDYLEIKPEDMKDQTITSPFKKSLRAMFKSSKKVDSKKTRLNKLLEYSQGQNLNKYKLDDGIIKMYQATKESCEKAGKDFKTTFLPIMEEMFKVDNSVVDIKSNFDNELEVLTIEASVLKIKQVTIRMDYKNGVGKVFTGKTSIVDKTDARFSKLFDPIHKCKSYHILKNKNLKKDIRVKKTQHLEKILWVVNHFGVALESGNLTMEVRINGLTYILASYGGCSLCGGMIVYCNGKMILVIEPSYNTGDERKILFDNWSDWVLSPILSHFKLYDVMDALALQYEEPPYFVKSDIDSIIKGNVMTALVFERMVKLPWVIISKLKGIIKGKTGDLCDFYDNSYNERIQNMVRKLRAMGFNNINTGLCEISYTNIQSRPVVATFDGTYYTCFMDQDGTISVYTEETTANTMLPEVIKLSKYDMKKKIIKSIMTGVEFWMTNCRVDEEVEMGMIRKSGALLRPMSEHMQQNTMVAAAAKKFRGQVEAKIMKMRVGKIYFTQKMMADYEFLSSHLSRYYNVFAIATLYPENNLHGMVEMLLAQSLYHSGYTDTLYITSNASTTVVCGLWSWFAKPSDNKYIESKFLSSRRYAIGNLANIIRIYQSDIESLEKREQLSDEEKKELLEKKAEVQAIRDQIEGNNEQWYGTDAGGKTFKNVVVSMENSNIKLSELIKISTDNNIKTITLLLPATMVVSETSLHKVEVFGNDQVMVSFKDSREVIQPNKQIVNMVNNGSAIDHSDHIITSHTKSIMYGIQVVDLTIEKKEKTLGNDARIFSPFRNGLEVEKVWIQYPSVNINLMTGDSSKLIITKHKKLVSKKLVLKLYERALRDDCNLSDLQAYGRSYLQTQMYTEKYVTTINKDGLDELNAACMVAIAEKNGLNDQLDATMKLIEKFKVNNDDCIQKILMKGNAKSLLELVNKNMAKLQDYVGIPDNFSELLKKLNSNMSATFIDEESGRTQTWGHNKEVTLSNVFKEWWNTNTENLEWINVGYVDDYRRIVRRSKRRKPKQSKTGGTSDYIKLMTGSQTQRLMRQSDWDARSTALPEPIAGIGESDVETMLTRGSMIAKSSNQPHISGYKMVKAKSKLSSIGFKTIRSFINRAAEVLGVIQNLDANDVKTIFSLVKQSLMEGSVNNAEGWKIAEDLRSLLDLDALTTDEVAAILSSMEKMSDKFLLTDSRNVGWSAVDWIKSSDNISDLTDEQIGMVLNLKKIDKLNDIKQNIVTDEDGNYLTKEDAIKLRCKLRNQWSQTNTGTVNSIGVKLSVHNLLKELNHSEISGLENKRRKERMWLDMASVPNNQILRVSTENMAITYEPVDTSTCVWDCIEQYFKRKVAASFKLNASIKAIMGNKKQLTTKECVTLCGLLCRNCIMFTEDGSGMAYINDNHWETITLMRVAQPGMVDHCVLVEVERITITGFKADLVPATIEPLVSKSRCHIDDKDRLDLVDTTKSCLNHVHVDGEGINLQMNRCFTDGVVELAECKLVMPPLNNLIPRLTRKVMCNYLIERVRVKYEAVNEDGKTVVRTEENWYESGSANTTKPGDGLLISSQGGYKLVMCLATAQGDVDDGFKKYVRLTEDHGQMAVVFDCGYHMIEKKLRVLTSRPTNTDNKVWALNIESQKYVENSLGLRTAVGAGEGILHIYHYDNKSHHKYNEKNILDNFGIDQMVIHSVVGKDEINWNYKALLKDRSTFRAAVLYGVPTMIMYCETDDETNIAEWWFKYLKKDILKDRRLVFSYNIDSVNEIRKINELYELYSEESKNNNTIIRYNESDMDTMDVEDVINEVSYYGDDDSTLRALLISLSTNLMHETGDLVYYQLRKLIEPLQVNDDDLLLTSGIITNGADRLNHVQPWSDITIIPLNGRNINDINYEFERERSLDDDENSKSGDESEIDESVSASKSGLLELEASGGTKGDDTIRGIETSTTSKKQMMVKTVHEFVKRYKPDVSNSANWPERVQQLTGAPSSTLSDTTLVEPYTKVTVNTDIVDEFGSVRQNVKSNRRWYVQYGRLSLYNPCWWYLAIPEMRELQQYKTKHNIKIKMNYLGHNVYRLNRIRFREKDSIFTHCVKPEVFFDILKHNSNNQLEFPKELQDIANQYLHGRVSWHVIFGKDYNKTFEPTCRRLIQKFEKVIVLTDYPYSYNGICEDANLASKLVLIKLASQSEPCRAIWWRFSILYADIPDDCELYILNGRDMTEDEFTMIDILMEEDMEGFDIVSALHSQTFNVCCGYAKYNHRVFNDYATFRDIYDKYGNSYGGDEIFMSRFHIKMMWLHYLIHGVLCYQVEGKWLNYANNTTFIIEVTKGTRIRIDGVTGLFCTANFFEVNHESKGIYDYTSIGWTVDGILWKRGLQDCAERLDDQKIKWWLNKENVISKQIDSQAKLNQSVQVRELIFNSNAESVDELVVELVENVDNCLITIRNVAESSIKISSTDQLLLVRIRISKEVIEIDGSIDQSTKNFLNNQTMWVNTDRVHVGWSAELVKLVQSRYKGKVIVVEGMVTKMVDLMLEPQFGSGVHIGKEIDELIWLPKNVDTELLKLQNLELQVKKGKLTLGSTDEKLYNILRLADVNAWRYWLETGNTQRLLSFDSRIVRSHSECVPTDLGSMVGQKLPLSQVLQKTLAECANHVDLNDSVWRKMVKRDSSTVLIDSIKDTVLTTGKINCVQRSSSKSVIILCQGISVTIVNQSSGGGDVTTSVETVDEAKQIYTTWNSLVESGKSNQLPFGMSPTAYQEKFLNVKKTTLSQQDKLNQLEHFDFVDAYALLDHNITDLVPKVGIEAYDLIPDSIKTDYELIEPIGGDLNINAELGESRNRDVNARIIDLWEDTDLREWITMYGPRNKVTVHSRVDPGPEKINIKTILGSHPAYSRPVVSKTIGMEFNAVTGRLGNMLLLRKEKINIQHEIRKFRSAYYRPDWQELVASYKNDTVTINDKDIKMWLSKRKDWLSLATTTLRLLESGLSHNPMNKVNVHVKTESLLKSNPIDNWRKTQGRIIVWQPKELCALMSPAFITIKKRLKEILRDGVLYTDGLTPDMLSSRLRTIQFDYIFEDDLEKQDRQTDQELIDLEFELMLELGLDIKLANLWRLVHNRWRYKGKESWGQLDAMRLTGQATTALGNAITNLCVHSSFVIEHKHAIKLVMILGDDNIMFLNEKPSLVKYKRLMSDRYNMVSKPNIDPNVGTFCSLICYRNSFGSAELGPDLIRLKRRFEVTGGGNQYELPIEVVQVKKIDDSYKTKYYNGRYILNLTDEFKNGNLNVWATNHGNRSYIAILEIDTDLKLDDKAYRKHDLRDKNPEETYKTLIKIGESMGMANAIMAGGMSYLHMIGSTKETEDINRRKGYGLLLTKWYDVLSCKNAICSKYGMSPTELDENLRDLLEMLDKPLVTHKRFKTISNFLQ